jgi:hypothetical protein
MRFDGTAVILLGYRRSYRCPGNPGDKLREFEGRALKAAYLVIVIICLYERSTSRFSIAQKKTQLIKPCTARLYELLGRIGYVTADGGRKQAVVIKWILR